MKFINNTLGIYIPKDVKITEHEFLFDGKTFDEIGKDIEIIFEDIINYYYLESFDSSRFQEKLKIHHA